MHQYFGLRQVRKICWVINFAGFKPRDMDVIIVRVDIVCAMIHSKHGCDNALNHRGFAL